MATETLADPQSVVSNRRMAFIELYKDAFPLDAPGLSDLTTVIANVDHQIVHHASTYVDQAGNQIPYSYIDVNQTVGELQSAETDTSNDDATERIKADKQTIYFLSGGYGADPAKDTDTAILVTLNNLLKADSGERVRIYLTGNTYSRGGKMSGTLLRSVIGGTVLGKGIEPLGKVHAGFMKQTLNQETGHARRTRTVLSGQSAGGNLMIAAAKALGARFDGSRVGVIPVTEDDATPQASIQVLLRNAANMTNEGFNITVIPGAYIAKRSAHQEKYFVLADPGMNTWQERAVPEPKLNVLEKVTRTVGMAAVGAALSRGTNKEDIPAYRSESITNPVGTSPKRRQQRDTYLQRHAAAQRGKEMANNFGLKEPADPTRPLLTKEQRTKRKRIIERTMEATALPHSGTAEHHSQQDFVTYRSGGHLLTDIRPHRLQTTFIELHTRRIQRNTAQQPQ